MKTNFFEQLAGLSLRGNLHLTIHHAEDGPLTVSLLLASADPKITATNHLPPLLLKGTPQQIDEHFFGGITQPLQATAELIGNLEAYQLALKKAGKAVATEKEVPAPDDTTGQDDLTAAEHGLFTTPADGREAKAAKKKQFDETMMQIKVLNGQMKYREALGLLPGADEYPDKVAEIEARPQYWMDFGNGRDLGQVILSTLNTIAQPPSKLYRTVGSLPMIIDEFGDLLGSAAQEEERTPSCSLAEALSRQDLFINGALAQCGASLLWQLFREGMLFNRGFFFNLCEFRTQPLKVG